MNVNGNNEWIALAEVIRSMHIKLHTKIWPWESILWEIIETGVDDKVKDFNERKVVEKIERKARVKWNNSKCVCRLLVLLLQFLWCTSVITKLGEENARLCLSSECLLSLSLTEGTTRCPQTLEFYPVSTWLSFFFCFSLILLLYLLPPLPLPVLPLVSSLLFKADAWTLILRDWCEKCTICLLFN